MTTGPAYDFFLAGVIQGSRIDRDVETQDYRARIKDIVARRTPSRTIYCPVDHHRESPAYDDADAHRVFHHHIDLATRCRFLIAVLPTASMGTAIEMWECARAGVPVIAITPMTHNWVVRLFSAAVFRDVEEFDAWLSEDRLEAIVQKSAGNLASVE